MAGDFATADLLLRDAARIQEERLGPVHPDLANTLNNLAVVVERTGTAGEAEGLYRRAAAIAKAALPSDHPMVLASRQNLEDFCRTRGLPVDPPVIVTPAEPTQQADVIPSTSLPNVSELPAVETDGDTGVRAAIPSEPAPAATSHGASHARRWLIAGLVILVAAAAILVRRSSRPDTSSAVPSPATTTQPAEPAPPAIESPSARPGTVAEPPKAATRPEGGSAKTSKPSSTGAIAVAVAEVCRTFSTSGGKWRCDPISGTVASGPLVLYTRIKSPRDITVTHRWYRGDTLRQSVSLTIRASGTEGFRTYSRQTVNSGDWRVEVRSADGTVLHEQRFVVR